MAYDEKLAERIRAYLADVDGLSERKMFGALCFMINGNMIGGPTGDACLIRVGTADYDAVIAEGVARPMEMGERTMRGFVVVDAQVLADNDALAEWIQIGLDVAQALPPKTGR